MLMTVHNCETQHRAEQSSLPSSNQHSSGIICWREEVERQKSLNLFKNLLSSHFCSIKQMLQ